jgi:hypothetical protein
MNTMNCTGTTNKALYGNSTCFTFHKVMYFIYLKMVQGANVIFIQHRRFESNMANTAIWHQEFLHGLETRVFDIISPNHNIKSTSLCNENLPDENQKPDALFSVVCS